VGAPVPNPSPTLLMQQHKLSGQHILYSRVYEWFSLIFHIYFHLQIRATLIWRIGQKRHSFLNFIGSREVREEILHSAQLYYSTSKQPKSHWKRTGRHTSDNESTSRNLQTAASRSADVYSRVNHIINDRSADCSPLI